MCSALPGHLDSPVGRQKAENREFGPIRVRRGGVNDMATQTTGTCYGLTRCFLKNATYSSMGALPSLQDVWLW